MRLLLDTHIVLWAMADDPKLRPSARSAMQETKAIYVSAVSIWEVAVKRALGKLQAPADFADAVRRTGILPLAITWQHATAAGALPPHHSDPFDRMLIAQARLEGLRLVTDDGSFGLYDVELG